MVESSVAVRRVRAARMRVAAIMVAVWLRVAGGSLRD
jgi:hypothetical protein